MPEERTSGTRPQRDFEWLSKYLKDARDAHHDFIRQPKPGTDPLFCHYTDFNGLKAIATEHDLWLTHALYCNDEAEIRLGIDVAREQIAKLKNERAPEEKKLQYFALLDKALSEPLREGVYICCFCEKGDDLSQWRAYGADGNGVSIQIDRNAFMKYGPVKPRYRAKRDMLIPYYSLKDLVLSQKKVTAKNWRLPIREVRIGPNRHRELNRACAQSLLTDTGYLVAAIASDTPYRS